MPFKDTEDGQMFLVIMVHRIEAWLTSLRLFVCLFSVPGVSGSSLMTGKGSGSILLNLDNEEQSKSGSAGQQQQQLLSLPPQHQQQQQQHGRPSCLCLVCDWFEKITVFSVEI